MKKLEAMKLIRRLTGWGLAKCRDYCEEVLGYPKDPIPLERC